MTSDDRVGVSPLQPFPSPGLPAMRNLKHITICFGMQPPRAVIDLDRLWVALKASGTCLMTISLDYGISDSLMEYLCSYEGLVEGRFNSRVPRTDKSLPSHSFAQVLSSHASSLTKLATVPNNGWLLADSYREEMALDPAMWPAPFLFLQLKSLLVAPPHNQEINVRNLQSLLDYTSEMPVLEALSINWSYELPFEQDLEHIWSRVSIKRSRLKELSIVVRNSFVVACATWAIEFPPLKEDMPNMRFKLKRFSPESGDREDSDSSS
ncbi:hypothetical protein AX16_006846 [Volvariella volvacea WC 439]|nr:hypothetical protein AX16_006846 [Volvariella volvacea WC 439]